MKVGQWLWSDILNAIQLVNQVRGDVRFFILPANENCSLDRFMST